MKYTVHYPPHKWHTEKYDSACNTTVSLYEWHLVGKLHTIFTTKTFGKFCLPTFKESDIPSVLYIKKYSKISNKEIVLLTHVGALLMEDIFNRIEFVRNPFLPVIEIWKKSKNYFLSSKKYAQMLRMRISELNLYLEYASDTISYLGNLEHTFEILIDKS